MSIFSHHSDLFASEWQVLMLFLIPVGGGIPGGVLLAKARNIPWPVMMVLYFISDVILACVFEAILKMVDHAKKRKPFVERILLAFKKSMDLMTSKYGIRMSIFSLVMISFGVDPMTGRVATMRAGYGFFSGWGIAITGDLIFFSLIMVSTLFLNNLLGDGTWTAIIIMVAMTVVPSFMRKIYGWWRMGRSSQNS
jgi:uncharacterized membrane protein